MSHARRTVWEDTLQHTATHCSTLQHTATQCNTHESRASYYLRKTMRCLCVPSVKYYNTLQHTATHCNAMKHTAIHCNTLRLVSLFSEWACCFNVFQCVAVKIWPTHRVWSHVNESPQSTNHPLQLLPLPRIPRNCNTLQHTATHCNTLQHTAIYMSQNIKLPSACCHDKKEFFDDMTKKIN